MRPGENLMEQIAAVGDYLVALETYRAAVKRWPKDKITLRNRARVLERSWQDWRALILVVPSSFASPARKLAHDKNSSMSLLTIWKPAPTATHTSPSLAALL
jgi:hypothetical protein